MPVLGDWRKWRRALVALVVGASVALTASAYKPEELSDAACAGPPREEFTWVLLRVWTTAEEESKALISVKARSDAPGYNPGELPTSVP